MANAGQIADLITQGVQGPTGDQDFSLVQGRIVSWDRLTGLNTVEVNGAFLTNVSALHTGIPTWFNAGDSVQLVRKQSRYFILGKVASPGNTAGSSVQFQTVGATIPNQGDTGGAWIAGDGLGPNLDVYLGSSRAVLILWGANVQTRQTTVDIGWAISGATTLAPAAFNNTTVGRDMGNPTPGTGGTIAIERYTVSGSYVMGPGAGLNAGLNTFSMRFKVGANASGATANISARTLTLIPL